MIFTRSRPEGVEQLLIRPTELRDGRPTGEVRQEQRQSSS